LKNEAASLSAGGGRRGEAESSLISFRFQKGGKKRGTLVLPPQNGKETLPSLSSTKAGERKRNPSYLLKKGKIFVGDARLPNGLRNRKKGQS